MADRGKDKTGNGACEVIKMTLDVPAHPVIAAKGSRQHRLELVDLFALRIYKTQGTDSGVENMLSEIVEMNCTESPSLHDSERGMAPGVIKNVQPAINNRKLAVRARKGNVATTTYLGDYTS